MKKYLYLAMALCAAVGFAYGLLRFFRSKSALYIRMIVYGIGCAMLGRLFETLQLFTVGRIQDGFHVGILGVVGSFLFFFSSNYGQMDSLVDDGSAQYRKYRLTALAAPAAVLGMFAVYAAFAGLTQTTVVFGVESAIIAAATYYHLKHLIIPDVSFGVIRSIRKYNLLALVYAFLCMGEMLLGLFAVPTVCSIILYVLLCIALLIFIPVLEGGIKTWSI